MIRQRVLVAPGFEWLPRSFDGVLDEVGVDHRACSTFARLRDLAVYAKVSRFDGQWHRLKVSARYPLTGAPRINEFKNLQRLAAAGIPVPSPIAAGEARENGLVARHFLVLKAVPGARNLAALLRTAPPDGPDLLAILERLAAAVARMHAAGFGHRDLFLRNVLVTPTGDVAFIDCRKGEWHGLQVRGVAFDLACFDKWATYLMPQEARAAFFGAYLRHARVSNPQALLASTERWRRWLVKRYLTKKRSEHRTARLLLDVPPLDVHALTSSGAQGEPPAGALAVSAADNDGDGQVDHTEDAGYRGLGGASEKGRRG